MTKDKVYSEVYSILNMLGKNYISKIPNDIYNAIKYKKDDTYDPKYDVNVNINNQGVSKDALSIITLFNIKYWAKEEKRDLLIKIIDANQKRASLELDKRYSEVFNSNKQNKKEETSLTNAKQSFFTKLINKIKTLFKRR